MNILTPCPFPNLLSFSALAVATVHFKIGRLISSAERVDLGIKGQGPSELSMQSHLVGLGREGRGLGIFHNFIGRVG